MNDKDRAKDLFIKALKCLEKRDFSYAEQIFVETLNLAPRSVPTLNNLAIAQYEQGKTDHAALTAQKVLEIDQNNIDAYLTLSTCQKDKLNRSNDCRSALQSWFLSQQNAKVQ